VKPVAIITGAAAGIGRGVAMRFGRDGYIVVVADVDAVAADKVVAEICELGGEAVFRHCDVTQRDEVVALVAGTIEDYGALHCLVNNAYPTGGLAAIEDKSDEEFRRALDGALFAARWSMNAAVATMKAQCFGRIINMCSLNGVNAHPMSADYNVAKEALRALTRTAAREWAAYGITVNAICPGALTPAFEAMQKHAPEMAQRVVKQVPMGYMGDPERDIAGVAAFLASEDSRYMTGNTLFVDGGGHINGINWASLFDD
jgi:NAD(P)-dependent dehydrogenase (short-subunit alcohol dehydrogenase family)